MEPADESPSIDPALAPAAPTREAPPLPAASAPTKRRRRTQAEIDADNVEKEARRVAREKAKQDKASAKKAREMEKAVRTQLAKESGAEKAPRFFWTDGATADLLDLIGGLKTDHDMANEAGPGFVSWNKFFKQNAHMKSRYETLKELPDETLDRRYKALLTSYRAVRDSCAATGGGGLHDQLARYNLSEQSYNAVGELHDSNPALNCIGGAMPQTASDDDDGGSADDRSHAGADHPEVESDIPWSESDVGDAEGADRPPAPTPSGRAAGSTRPSSSARASTGPAGSSRPTRPALSRLTLRQPTVEAGVGRPPSTAASGQDGVRAGRRRANRDAVEAVTQAQSAMDSGLNAVMLMQRNAAEREAERDARREAREDRLEDERLQREERRERERHEYRMAELARQEREDEQRAIERQNNRMMQLMIARMLGGVAGPDAGTGGAGGAGDGSGHMDGSDIH